jgi:hypothetical protein
MPRFAPARRSLVGFSLALLAALAPLGAAAQKASSAQVDAVSAVAECLATGLPQSWKRLQVIIELREPYAETGGVRYLITRPDDQVEPFRPCDPSLPPVKLLALRDSQPAAERGWTKLILTMQPDASFDMKYEYPPALQTK